MRKLTGRLTDPRTLPIVATIVLFAALFGFGSVMYTGFFSMQVLTNLFVDNAFLLVVAIGMTFVILSGGIDLSVGAVVALTTILCAVGAQWLHWPIWVVVPIVLVFGTLYGAAMGALIHFFCLQPFIITLAGMFLARGACFLITTQSIPIDEPTFHAVASLNIPVGGGSLNAGALIGIVALAVAIFVAHFTRFGRNVYAIGGNERSALLMGLPVARTKVAVYALSGFCSALGGVIFTLYVLSGYGLQAQGMELDAIAATVIGGTLLTGGVGYVIGSLFGVGILGTIQTLITFDGTLSSWWTRIVIGALLCVFCLLQRIIERHAGRRRAGGADLGPESTGPSHGGKLRKLIFAKAANSGEPERGTAANEQRQTLSNAHLRLDVEAGICGGITQLQWNDRGIWTPIFRRAERPDPAAISRGLSCQPLIRVPDAGRVARTQGASGMRRGAASGSSSVSDVARVDDWKVDSTTEGSLRLRTGVAQCCRAVQTFELDGSTLEIAVELENIGRTPLQCGIDIRFDLVRDPDARISAPAGGIWIARSFGGSPRLVPTPIAHRVGVSDLQPAAQTDRAFTHWGGRVLVEWPARQFSLAIVGNTDCCRLGAHPEEGSFSFRVMNEQSELRYVRDEDDAHGLTMLDAGKTLSRRFSFTVERLAVLAQSAHRALG